MKIDTFNNNEYSAYNAPIFPGGDTNFDFSGKISIEFTFYDGFPKSYPEFTKASLLALYEIKEK